MIEVKKIGDVCDVVKGVTGIMKAIPGKYPMVTLATERASNNEYQFDCRAVIIQLVSSTGHGHASMKRVHYQEGKFALGSILAAIIPLDEKKIHPKYLHIYLSYFKDELLVPLMSGAANVTLSIKSINSVEIIVPPYKKQLEIIKLEEVLSRQKKSIETKLSDQKIILQKIRQAILQDAISGKLTVDWRKKNLNVEPASELLKKIKAEKEKLIAEKKVKKEKLLPEISEKETPFELPKWWEWVRLGEIINFQNGFSFQSNDFHGSDCGVIRIGDIQNELIIERKMKFVKKEIVKNISDDYRVLRGDVVIAMSGVTTGKIGINKSGNVYYLNQRVGRIDTFLYPELKAYLIYLLSVSRKKLLTVSNGSIIDNLSTEQIKNFITPIPPLIEQKAIVAKVENLMQKLDKLETEISQNQKTADKLMQSVLKETFKK